VTVDIFISYSKKDSTFAIKLANDLQSSGHKIWIDRSLKVGEIWEQTIEKKLEEAKNVIVILSNNAVASRWVQHEGSIAYGLKKNMFPVLIEDVPSENLPLWANKFQYHSFLNTDYQTAFKSLNAILMPPNPYQDILEMQVSTYQRTGALIDESLLNVINENRQSLMISTKAKELIKLSSEKVTEQKERLKETQQKLMASKRLSSLGVAMATLQHRINNSFNIIIPNVTRLRSRVDLNNPTIVEILDIIERNARYTSEIIARIQGHLSEDEVQEIDVNILLKEIVDRFASNESYNRNNIKMSLDNSVPTIKAPSGQLVKVFENIIDNALSSMLNDGELQIISRLEKRFVFIYFMDTGEGIPQDILERLFVQPVPSQDPEGRAGLGLWLSNLVLQALGGDICIEKSDHAGTTILIELPVEGRTTQHQADGASPRG
jgi:signal transduction histidine kinase